MDWRFSEFPNEGAHGLYVTCVELMILNMDPVAVGERLVDVILENSCHIPGRTVKKKEIRRLPKSYIIKQCWPFFMKLFLSLEVMPLEA